MLNKGSILSTTESAASSSVVTPITSSASSVVLAQANALRKMLVIYNDSTSVLYLNLSPNVASTSNFSYPLAPLVNGVGGVTVIRGEDYSGEVRGIWASANGFARITETI